MDGHARDAVLELQERSVVAGDGAVLHPLAVHAAHPPHLAAGDEPDAVYLVRRLAVDEPAALVGVQLVSRARADHPVRVGDGVHRAELSQFAGRHDLAHEAYVRLKALRVPRHELDAVAVARLHHLFRLADVQRHRLLDHDMLAVVRREHRHRAVEAVGRGYPHRLDVRVGAERLRAVVDARAFVARLEALADVRVDVGAGEQVDVGSALHGRQHLSRAHADADHSQLQGFGLYGSHALHLLCYRRRTGLL